MIRAYGVLDEARNVAWRSTFIVDRAGSVRFAYVGEQPHERPDVETILAELKRLEPAK